MRDTIVRGGVKVTVESERRRPVRVPPKRAKEFVTIYTEMWPRLMLAGFLNATERVFLASIIGFLQWNTNTVMNPEGHTASVSDLMQMTGLAKNTLRKAVNGLVSKGVIREVRTGHRRKVVLNPKMAFKGRAIDPALEREFLGVEIRLPEEFEAVSYGTEDKESTC